MKLYIVTEEQLSALQSIVWGAKMTSPEEPGMFNEIIRQIKTQDIEIKS